MELAQRIEHTLLKPEPLKILCAFAMKRRSTTCTPYA